MGLFTSVIHPDDGRELQIKSGIDDCETYHVGDEVHWFVDRQFPRRGKLLDDVYDSFSGRGPDDWVVIKDHKIHAVVPRTENGYADYQSLREQFGIEDLPDSEWTEEGWKWKREREEKCRKENEEFRKSIAHLPPKEQLALCLARPLSKQLGYAGIARRILKIDPL
jgi:hypothetical protein